MSKATNTEVVEPLIHTIREHRVVLDSDLARLYGIPTFRFNEAFKRNRRRFPPDFAFQLTGQEFEHLRAQLEMSSQFAMTSRRAFRYRPWVFTEHGALMAANILRSERAVQMSVFVVRAFVRMREQVATNDAILKRLAEIDRTLLQHGFHSGND